MTNKRKYPEIKAEILQLQKIDNATSDRVEHELNVMDEKEKEMEIEVERVTKEYHKIKRNELPVYKKREFKIPSLVDDNDIVISVWLYKLDIIKGKLVCQRMDIKQKTFSPIELHSTMIEDILDARNISSDATEWQDGVAKLLTQMDNPK